MCWQWAIPCNINPIMVKSEIIFIPTCFHIHLHTFLFNLIKRLCDQCRSSLNTQVNPYHGDSNYELWSVYFSLALMKQMGNYLVRRQNVCGSSDSSRPFQATEVLLQCFAPGLAPYAPWLSSLLLAHVGHGKHLPQTCMTKVCIRQSNYKWYSKCAC
jgi:hypothetical protein